MIPTAPVAESSLRFRYQEVEPGVRLHFADKGEGPLVVLLHGFPDFWFGWRLQFNALVEAGFRVVAPDQRGYNLSDKPSGVRPYVLRRLADDVAAFIRGLGYEKASVVGHDWGAGVAWAFAMQHPDLLDRLAILNGPHPSNLLRALRTPAQLAKSWYMFMFQVPWLPEALLTLDNYRMLVTALPDDPNARERYAEAYRRPGALTSMVNWYRGLTRPRSAVELRKIEAPVLVLWGKDDPFLGVELATPPANLVPNAKTIIIPEATHWVHTDAPALVNEELVSFLRPLVATRGGATGQA